ncbi:signal recognition particle 19kDa [Pleodorina starrii]|uniref:Signal recognition particle 19kDa n=1 Tax=Pleodorina starrii TaxID=330485 RepID=A0A9W6BTU7_9CHLO|nr:signal recognition particle 19kDa [Pleodorina starrii]GLC57865.1 signal recognition particle 19kDa [Pleodorina starrii]GLC69934.1 signal recognition particle 19kDa [Pleodorina starrii]
MNPDKRVIVYPQYLDANKTVAEGRRIPKDLACDAPFVSELYDCCNLLKLESAIEAKHYPRDWLPKGRIRVQLKGDDGKPVNPEIPNRRTLLLKLAELIPKHPGRAAGGKARQQSAAAKLGEMAGGAGGSGSGAGPSGSAAAAAGGGGGAGGSKPAPSKKGKKGKK